MEKHSQVETCAQCHCKIDPLRFALENFDPIGAWRDLYPRGKAGGPHIDATGRLPDGAEFDDIAGLKKILVGRKRQFACCLVEKLLTYVLGRKLEASDRPHIDELVNEMDRRDGGLQDLIQLIVASSWTQWNQACVQSSTDADLRASG